MFEDSPIAIGKWLMVIWMLTADKNGVSSYEIHRSIGVTQKTAWFMMHRVRLALKQGSFEKMSGTVEVDETFLGGELKNMKKGKLQAAPARPNTSPDGPSTCGTVTKSIVLGMLERGKNGEPSQMRTQLVEIAAAPTCKRLSVVEPNSMLK